MAKITRKSYYCPICKAEYLVETNHFGEIYSGCKNCGNSILYCAEPEAMEERNNWPTTKTVIHTYYYDVSIPEEKEAYQELCEKIKVKCFNVIDTSDYKRRKIIESLNNKEVTLYTRQVFDNQWISEIGRLMDWYEGIVPNKKLKIGYYLEITKEMDDIRNNRVGCRYCGNQLPVGKTCDKTPDCINYGMKSLKTRYKKGE